jgi:large repetitive protein
VIKNSNIPQFGDVVGEILRTEGVSSFDVLELNAVVDLSPYGLVLLPETPLTPDQIERFTRWVIAGGRLLAMRPDDGLSSLLGVAPSSGTVGEGYLQIDAARWGIAGVPLQFHGTADLHAALDGTAVEAALFASNRVATGFPAITIRDVGAGKAVAIMYDLARSVVLTRQGNPARLFQSLLLDSVPRSGELFANGFLDVNNYAIPQADEQQRMLVNLMFNTYNDRMPLPRFWYLPGGRRAAVMMTGDDHNIDATADFFDLLSNPPYSPVGCSVADWTCARATSWVYSGVNRLKNGAAQRYTLAGFEIGPHVSMNVDDGPCSVWGGEADVLARFNARLGEFQSTYGIAPAATHRTHCFAFADWDTTPRIEARLGIRLDENYTPFALPGTQNRLGRINGGAMPMRFASFDGPLIDVYQVASDFDYEYFSEGTSSDQMRQAFAAMIDGAVGPSGFWGVIGTHYGYSQGLDADMQRALLAELAARNANAAVADQVAMISARQLLDWLDLRNQSGFTELGFDGQSLSFSIEVRQGLPNPGLEAMVPVAANGRGLSQMIRDGQPVTIKRRFTVRTVEYAFFDALPGNYVATYQ